MQNWKSSTSATDLSLKMEVQKKNLNFLLYEALLSQNLCQPIPTVSFNQFEAETQQY